MAAKFRFDFENLEAYQKAFRKKRYYKYSYNSARECVPILALGCSLEAITEKEHQSFRQELVGVIQMIAKLIKGVDKKKSKNAKNNNGKANNGKTPQAKENAQN